MPSCPIVPAPNPARQFEPAAVYPVATEEGWDWLAPVVSAIRIPDRGTWCRTPIGSGGLKLEQVRREHAIRCGYWPPLTTEQMPPIWHSDVAEDVGGTYQQRGAA